MSATYNTCGVWYTLWIVLECLKVCGIITHAYVGLSQKVATKLKACSGTGYLPFLSTGTKGAKHIPINMLKICIKIPCTKIRSREAWFTKAG